MDNTITEQRAKVFKDLNYRVDETEISFGGVCIKLSDLGKITEEEFKSAVVYAKEHFKPNVDNTTKPPSK